MVMSALVYTHFQAWSFGNYLSKSTFQPLRLVTFISSMKHPPPQIQIKDGLDITMIFKIEIQWFSSVRTVDCSKMNLMVTDTERERERFHFHYIFKA